MSTDHPDVLNFGHVSSRSSNGAGKRACALRDPNAETRRDFTGCKWFPADAAWRVQAKWVAYPQPKKIAITNILGMTDQEPSPGYAEFTLQGKTLRLEPVVEDGELFFMFKDATSGKTTYGAGRFLYAAMPKGNTVELDFNKAHNPPCAFTAFRHLPSAAETKLLHGCRSKRAKRATANIESWCWHRGRRAAPNCCGGRIRIHRSRGRRR